VFFFNNERHNHPLLEERKIKVFMPTGERRERAGSVMPKNREDKGSLGLSRAGPESGNS
jgi:hypothetical protein